MRRVSSSIYIIVQAVMEVIWKDSLQCIPLSKKLKKQRVESRLKQSYEREVEECRLFRVFPKTKLRIFWRFFLKIKSKSKETMVFILQQEADLFPERAVI